MHTCARTPVHAHMCMHTHTHTRPKPCLEVGPGPRKAQKRVHQPASGRGGQKAQFGVRLGQRCSPHALSPHRWAASPGSDVGRCLGARNVPCCQENKRAEVRLVCLETSGKASWRAGTKDRREELGSLDFLENQGHVLCCHLFSTFQMTAMRAFLSPPWFPAVPRVPTSPFPTGENQVGPRGPARVTL